MTLRQFSMVLMICSFITCGSYPVVHEAGADPIFSTGLGIAMFVISGLIYVYTGSYTKDK